MTGTIGTRPARLPLSPVTREASGPKQGQQCFTALTPGNGTLGYRRGFHSWNDYANVYHDSKSQSDQ